MSTLRVIEILDRAHQGITRPFLCLCDDGGDYYVKGAYAGRRGLVAEFIAGRLAVGLDLPIPRFAVVDVPGEVIAMSSRDDRKDLGAGPAFASRVVRDSVELRYAEVSSLSEELCARILLFDWWILNGDRTLSEHGGNPNLLRRRSDRSLHIIDHNLAFDPEAVRHFWTQHIFRWARRHWTASFRAGLEGRMKPLLEQLAVLWRELPDDWAEAVDQGQSAIRRVLARLVEDPGAFWSS